MFDSITNRAEFFSYHYLNARLKADLGSLRAAWDAAEGRDRPTARIALRAAPRAFFAARATAFESAQFASGLRLALRSVGVPAGLPDEGTALREHVSGAELRDGPYGFAEVRNRLVHPPRKTRGWPPTEVMIDSWRLGIEYLALLILAALGYEGQYRSQFSYSGFMGDEVPVPWSRQESGARSRTVGK